MIDYLGWAATAVFVGSYFCARAVSIKRVQMLGALMWAAYGVLIGAPPVIVANLLVFGAAAWTSSLIPKPQSRILNRESQITDPDPGSRRWGIGSSDSGLGIQDQRFAIKDEG